MLLVCTKLLCLPKAFYCQTLEGYLGTQACHEADGSLAACEHAGIPTLLLYCNAMGHHPTLLLSCHVFDELFLFERLDDWLGEELSN